MAMLYLFVCLFIGCGVVHVSHGSVIDVSIVTQINSTQLDIGLVYFRSLWHYNSRESVDGGAMYGHACVSGIDLQMFEEHTVKYANIGVVLHQLHDVSLHHPHATLSQDEEAEWRNLICTAQIADYYFMHNVLVMHVLFVSVNFMIVADLRTSLLGRVSLPSLALSPDQRVHCMPKQISIEPGGDAIGGMCEMDVFFLSSRLGTEFYGVLNATKPLSLFAFQALEVAVRSVSAGLVFLQPRASTTHRGDMVIRDGRMWTGQQRDARGVALIEFGNRFNRMDAVECHLYLSFDFSQHFKTDLILSGIFARGMSHIENFCSEEPLFAASVAIDLDGLGRGAETPLPAIFDLIIFNDEIELLLLRLEFLRPFSMTHVIVESETTFTGNQKPLHFQNNRELFSEYNVVSFMVPLDRAPPLDDRAVWGREHHARNCLFAALEHLGARDRDVILVSDVDEIAHPRALQTLLAIHSHTYSPASSASGPIHSSGYRGRIHKLHYQTYMYGFDCFLRKEGQLLSRSALTATTLGYAKQLFPENNHSSLITSVRTYQQHVTPYALEDVLEPGGWHLTFFGGVQRIKSKLSSYSHRNIRRTFVSDEEGAQLEEYGAEAEKFFTSISHKIASGDQIDDREKEKCSINEAVDDEDTARLKRMWAEVVLKMQRLSIS